MNVLCDDVYLLLQPPFLGSKGKIQQKIVKDKIKLPQFLSNEAHALLKGVSYHHLHVSTCIRINLIVTL